MHYMMLKKQDRFYDIAAHINTLQKKEKKMIEIIETSTKTVLQELKKKPRIKGVNGFLNMDWVEKIRGKRDFNTQLCITDNSCITPHIVKIVRRTNAYKNEMYLYIDKNMHRIYQEISRDCATLELLKNDSDNSSPVVSAKSLRDKERELNRQASRQASIRETMIRLMEYKQCLETVNVSVKHHIEETDDLLRSKISAYWSGILAKNKNQKELPVYPSFHLESIEGQDVYTKNFDKIIKSIQTAVEGE